MYDNILSNIFKIDINKLDNYLNYSNNFNKILIFKNGFLITDYIDYYIFKECIVINYLFLHTARRIKLNNINNNFSYYYNNKKNKKIYHINYYLIIKLILNEKISYYYNYNHRLYNIIIMYNDLKKYDIYYFYYKYHIYIKNITNILNYYNIIFANNYNLLFLLY